MMEASPWWWSLREQPNGDEVIRDLLHQLLSALAVLQQANITHRYQAVPCLLSSQIHHVKVHARLWGWHTVWQQHYCCIVARELALHMIPSMRMTVRGASLQPHNVVFLLSRFVLQDAVE